MVKRYFFTLFFLIIFAVCSHATWSIIIIDPKTKEIGIAGASCTYSVYGIGAIVPGKGAIVVQAMSNNDARKKGIAMIIADASPEEILRAIKDPEFDPEEQQYAIMCVKFLNKPETFTGNATTGYKGTLTAKGISVQGNTLSSSEELKEVLNAAIKAQKKSLPIQEVLMLALEAGAKYGGDKRCGERKAASAFLTIMKPNDSLENPYLNLVIYGNDEKVNAVEALRNKFKAWKAGNKPKKDINKLR